jgi:putative ABC transport system permease protein
MPEKLLGFFEKQPHVVMATGTIVNPLGGFDTLTGLDFEPFNRMSGGFRFIAGGPFQNRLDVILDEFYANQKKLTVGSTVELMSQQWRVVGIVEPGKLGRIFCQLTTLQELTSNSNKLSQIFLKVDDEKQAQAVVDSLRLQLPKYFIYTMEEFTSLISISKVDMLRGFIYVVIGIAVIVGFIVVFMAMYTAVLERTREIGILKALGASPRMVLSILARETILIALLGLIAGILMSYGTRFIIGTLIPATLVQEIVPDWWLISGAIAIAGALLGAIYPGWKAARQDAIEALSYE